MSTSRRNSVSLRRQSVHGGAWAAAGAAGAAAVGLVNFLILSRMLSPAVYGLMAMVEVSLALAQRLMTSGLSEPLVQIAELEEEHADTMFWTLQVAGLVVVGSVIGASGAIAQYFSQPSLPPLISATAVTLYLQATSLVPSALLARRFHFQATAQANVISEFVGGVIGIALAFRGFGVWSLVAQRVSAAAVQCGVVLWMARWRPSLRWSARALRSVWRYSASRGTEGLLLFVDLHVPRIILGRIAGAAELGYFIYARRLVENSVSIFHSPLRMTGLRTFAAIQSDLPRVRRVYSEAVGVTASVTFPVSVGIALVAYDLVEVLAGARWRAAAPLLQILVLASIRQSFHVWNAALLRGLGEPQLLLGASLLRSSVILALLLCLQPWHGPGVAMAILLGSCLSWPAAIRFVKRVAGLSMAEQWRPGRVPAIATGVMAAGVLAVQWLTSGRLSAPASLAVDVAAGASLYAAVMVTIGKTELRTLLRLFEVLRSQPGARTPSEGTTEADGM